MAIDREIKLKKMKKILIVAVAGLISLFTLSAFTPSVTNTPTKNVIAKETKVELSAGLLGKSSSLKESLSEPPRTYTTTCGTWTVTGNQLLPEMEQDFCNQACANGWTTWSYVNGVFTGH
jgi:maltose-binding protein MalE